MTCYDARENKGDFTELWTMFDFRKSTTLRMYRVAPHVVATGRICTLVYAGDGMRTWSMNQAADPALRAIPYNSRHERRKTNE